MRKGAKDVFRNLFRNEKQEPTQQFDIRFTEPRFLGRDLAAGFDLFSLRTDFSDQSSFTNQSTGLGLRASFPLTERTGMGLTYSLLGVIVAEILASNHGLGPLNAASAASFNTAGVFAGLIMLAVVAWLFSLAMRKLEARLLRWKPSLTSA